VSWADLFERAHEHEATTETIRSTLVAVRECGASDDEAEGG